MSNIGGGGPNQSVVCYAPNMITTNGMWLDDDPLDYSLPVFVMQVTLVVVTTRILVFLLKPFRQPRVIAEILGGIMLGPSVIGKSQWFQDKIFPLKSIMVLETMANIGLLYFLFLVGVEMDISIIKRTGKRAFIIAVAGMIFPFGMGAGASYALKDANVSNIQDASFVLFMGVSISVTAFPVLARILAELKLLNTELGRVAMSSAIVNDMCAWILLALAIALAEKDTTTWASVGVIFSGILFVLLCIFVIRPAMYWVVRNTPEGENFNELHIALILTGVMICGFLTDAIGTHSIFGAFVYGLVIPNGPLGITLVEKLEDFVSGLLLPLFFAISGLRTNLASIRSTGTWGVLLAIIILSCAAKIGVTLLIAVMYQMPFRDGLALGLLMNTKGLIEMIILNVGKDQKVLDDSSFAIMVLMAVVTTSTIAPMIINIYKPTRRIVAYRRRTIQRSKPDSELRMLACIHTPRNVPTIVNLLEATHPTKRSPICVYVLHLVELTGRASAMLIVHNTRKSGTPALNSTQAQSDHIVNAFENYEQHAVGVSIQPLTAISPYSTMHEDICNLAEDKRVAFIIVPFHKQQTVDGGMEATNPAFRTVNQNVLANAPCSIGILVDRGLGGSTRITATNISHHIIVLFFGGPDDREALAYASRMTDHPGINLTIIRFIPGDNVVEHHEDSDSYSNSNTNSNDQRILTVVTDMDRENQLDEDFINAFKLKNANKDSITYMEKVVNNGEETVAVIRSIESIHDLYIVGRGQGMTSPLTSGLTDWSECPELGPIGDLLASSDFAATVSVLVVQQYVGFGTHGDGLLTPDSPGQHNHYFNNMQNHTTNDPITSHQNGTNNDYGTSWRP